VVPHVSTSHLLTRGRVDTLAERLTTLSDHLDDRGFDLLVHNTRAMHFPLLDRYRLASAVESSLVPRGGWQFAPWVFERLTPERWRGQTAFERLVAQTGPELTFEIDTKEVATAGGDLSTVLDLVDDRVQAVHLSNATRTRQFPPAYSSSGIAGGVVDVRASLRSVLDRPIDWVIVESEDAAETLTATTEAIDRRFSTLSRNQFRTRDAPDAERS